MKFLWADDVNKRVNKGNLRQESKKKTCLDALKNTIHYSTQKGKELVCNFQIGDILCWYSASSKRRIDTRSKPVSKKLLTMHQHGQPNTQYSPWLRRQDHQQQLAPNEAMFMGTVQHESRTARKTKTAGNPWKSMEILQNRLCWWHNDRKPTLRYDLIFEKSLNCRDWDSFLLPAFAKKSRPLPVGCNSTRPDWCCRRCHVDGMSCKNGSSKASGKPSIHPSTFKPSNLQATT